MKPPSLERWNILPDLRWLLVLMIAGLIISNWRPDFWYAPSKAVAQFALWLKPPHRSPPQVALLPVEEPEKALWGFADERPGEKGLPEALHNLLEQNNIVGMVVRHPVESFDLSSRQLAPLISGTVEQPVASLTRYVQRQQRTQQLLREERLVMGLSAGAAEASPGDRMLVGVEQGALASTVPLLRSWLWPIAGVAQGPRFPVSELHYHPVLTEPQAEQKLLYGEGGQVYGGFALQLLQRYQEAGARENDEALSAPLWRRDRGIQGAGGQVLPLSATGSLVPLVQGYSTMAPSFAELSLSAASNRQVNNGIVLIGSSNDPLLERLAATVVGMVEGLVLVEPHWFAPLMKCLLLLCLPLLLLLFPRLSVLGGLSLWAGLSLVLLAGQFIGHQLYAFWLPVADLVWATGTGYVAMAIWQQQEKRRLATQQQFQVSNLSWLQAEQSNELLQAQHALTGFAAGAGGGNNRAPATDAPDGAENAGRVWPTPTDERVSAVGGEPHSRGEIAREVPAAQAGPGSSARAQYTAAGRAGSAATVLASTQVMELEGPMTLGRYEIQREIGRGAMGTVYLAYDPKIARKVAIKTLNFKHLEERQLATVKERFFREAAAAGRLNHPHIVSVFDVGEEQDLAFIAMDYVEGSPLSTRITESCLLPAFDAYRAIANVARALHYAHGKNVIHRDIKPANIMYADAPYQLKVTDFGIARLIDDSRTSTGEILGSPLYIAPEQLQGKTLTPSVDIFSLGVTFYQLLTGALPFAGDNLASLTYDILYGKPRSVRKLRPDLPLSAARIVNRALQKDTSRRYESALEMAEALEKAMRKDFPREAKIAGYIN